MASRNRFVDISGLRFGMTVASRYCKDTIKWECLCDCGNIHFATSTNLRHGRTGSCGCKRLSAGGVSASRVHRIWRQMLKRCTDCRLGYYSRYGGRGISVCDRWRNSFEAFLEDMGQPPSPKHSIDRINNDGNYEPGNCRWATSKEQARNRRSSVVVEFQGISATIAEWAEISGVHARAISKRLRLGWTMERAISEPLRPQRLPLQ